MQTLPFSEARAQLAHALRSVEVGDEDAVLISRRGQAAGVLISVAQYQQFAGKNNGFMARLQQWRNGNLAQSPQQTDEADPFDNLRQNASTRDFAW